MRGLSAILAAILAAVLQAGPAAAQTTALSETATSRIEVGRGGEMMTFHTVNSSFEWVGIYQIERDEYQHLVLKKIEEATVSSGLDGSWDARVTLEVSEVAGTALHPLYTIQDGGERGYVDSFAWSSNYFTTVRYGCCGALDTYRTYSLLNGRPLFSATGPAAWFEVPNSRGLVRLAALHTIFSTDDETVFAGQENALALLTFAAPSERLQRFMISFTGQLANDAFEYPDPWLGWSEGEETPQPELEVWSQDGTREAEALQGLTLSVQVAPNLSLTLPLVRGRLSLEGAAIPTGLTVRELAAE